MGRSVKQRTPPVPVGGLLQLAGASGPNLVIDGAEYLKTSVLKSIAGYEALLTSAVDLTVAVGTPGLSTISDASGVLLAANGWLYGVGSSSSLPSKTSDPLTVAWSSLGGVAAVPTDGFVFGTRGVIVAGSTIWSLLNGTRTDITPTVAQTVGAANDAGTLAVTAANLNGVAGHITTSTDGLTWTDRTSTGGVGISNGVALCDWSQPGGVFMYVNPNGHVYTASNGYTLTDRGAIAGATAASVASTPFKSRSRSATSNLMLLNLTIGGVSSPYIVRTTDGVAFTATLAATALALDGFVTATGLAITRVDGKYVIYRSAASGVTSSIYYTSSDDGLTWQRGSVPINPAMPTTALLLLAPGNSGQVLAMYTAFNLAVLTSLSATHVGIAKNLSAVMPYYVRIK